MNQFPFAFWKSSGEWPFGALGDLTITTGVTTTLAVDAIYDYNNITIQTGGKLRLRYKAGVDNSGLVVLGVHGNFDLSGTIEMIYAPVIGGTATLGPLVAPDGYSLSYSVACGTGGDAGDIFGGSGAATGDVGGAGGSGNGTGTGGGADGDGGAGALGIGGTADGFTGAGGVLYGGNGGTGQSRSGSATVIASGGGGGGALSWSGGGLYIKCAGTCSGTGTVNVSGNAGGYGGDGGVANNLKITNPKTAYGGGGGGGGAGAGGGKVVLRHKGSAPGWTYNVAGGAGGAGGLGGLANSTGIHVDGDPGQSGTAGTNGSTDIAAY